MDVPKLPIGDAGAQAFDFVAAHFTWLFDAFKVTVTALDAAFSGTLLFIPAAVWIVAIAALCWRLVGLRLALFALLSLLLLLNQGLWEQTMVTLSLVLTSTLIALAIALPLGILMAESRLLRAALGPLLDFIQTMPRFVYLIPAVVLLGIDVPPAVFATLTLAVVPPIRVIATGLDQVDPHMIEAARAYGATRFQILRKVKIPLAIAAIMLGVNQCIMMSLSMVVIASLIGAAGLGSEILNALSSLDAGRGVVASIGIFVLAVLLDRITRAVALRLPGGTGRHFSRGA
jgi:ABC-type proline/glycine betaine transport system permease subunit